LSNKTMNLEEADDREIRKLEYLKRRGASTLADDMRLKELVRKKAIKEFDSMERSAFGLKGSRS
jgi:hypothetical protein